MGFSWLLQIISGKQRGLFAEAVRLYLWCWTPIYRFMIARRNRQFDTGATKSDSVAAKVISIGNITTGGTGKTPMVVWICQLLQQNGIHVGIVSRGYGAKKRGEQNDEAMELTARLPDVPHVQNPNRVAGANRCIEDHDVNAIVLDDGFQHRRIARDLDIVLIDASNPFGYEHLIPRGLLREPVSSLSRADIVAITRCERVDAAAVESTRERIAAETPAPIVLVRTTARSLLQPDGTESSIDELKSGKWYAFSAIGNPAAFEGSLTELGCNVVGSSSFRDHHSFEQTDYKMIGLAARKHDADFLVCTHKDLVKFDPTQIDLPVYALKIELNIFEGRDALRDAVLNLFSPLETL